MAAPESKTLQQLAGKWRLNKSLYDDYTEVLAVQGVNVLLRKAIGTASVHLKVKQLSANEIHMEQTAIAASIPGTTEEYVLDWQWRTQHDAFFGDIKGRSRWISQEEGKSDDADGQWLQDDSEHKLIQATGMKPDETWTATHLWGFEEVDRERRHTRRVRVTSKDGKNIKVRMVYDFEGD